MGLFIREDPGYQEDVRQTGLNRYKQLLSIRSGQWWKTGMMTLAGLVPLATGIVYSICVSSMLVLIPCSILGGVIAGPFLAGLYDAVLQGLRDDPLPWKDAWVRSWRQNWRENLLPGAVTGLMAGLYTYGHAVLVGGDGAQPGHCGAVPVLHAAPAGTERPVLDPAGAVWAVPHRAAAKLPAVLHQTFWAGDGDGTAPAGLPLCPGTLHTVGLAPAAHHRPVVHHLFIPVFGL